MRYSYVAATLVGSALAMPQYGYSAVVPTGYQPAPTSSKPYEASTPSAYHASTPASSKVYEASTPSSQLRCTLPGEHSFILEGCPSTHWLRRLPPLLSYSGSLSTFTSYLKQQLRAAEVSKQ
ncbi:hypothetical protein CC77DRAFT_804317 [Alternaria alternata]|uniref:Uncharacterized protein n=1 Tax=Alternaria alternata TaxID=5599 RepID=A0A177DRY6_ALTAL|nr:hypothetical protein CC77DRAFT_804317 [Alternaria alternata]OAG21499.1 hypothetical protein CC77DRAFT_804317 [Alternaria alternata]